MVVPEYIDDFNMVGQALDLTLLEIEWVNKYLGGINTSVYPILKYIQEHLQRKVTVVDIGCGSGDILKKIQKVSKHVHIPVNLVGVDANEHILDFAREKHFQHQQIQFVKADVLLETEKIPFADVYMLNLFLHHFEMTDIRKILNNLLEKGPGLIVVNDLQRSRLAYILFTLLCKVKRTSTVTFHDGRLSITKGFDKKEMISMAEGISGYEYKLHWRWAFRWQLLLIKKQ